MLISKDNFKKLIRNIIFETKFMMSDPSDEHSDSALNAKNISREIGSEVKYKKFKSQNKFKKYLKDISGPNVFIRFVKEQEKGKPAEFNLSPFAKFNTPHGIYAYPFDKENALKFIYTGLPTDAHFATDYPFFHLFKVDLNHENVFVFDKNQNCNKKVNTNEYLKKAKELIRISCHFKNEDFNNDIAQNIFDKCKEESLNDIKDNYAKLYKLSNLLSKRVKSHSELFALLLNRIGMKCIIDKGSSLIHSNEPSQMHILSFGEDKSFYRYIGTYDNKIQKSKDDIYTYISSVMSRNESDDKILSYYESTLYKDSLNFKLINLMFNLCQKDDDLMNRFLIKLSSDISFQKFDLEIDDMGEYLKDILPQNVIDWIKNEGLNSDKFKYYCQKIEALIKKKDPHNNLIELIKMQHGIIDDENILKQINDLNDTQIISLLQNDHINVLLFKSLSLNKKQHLIQNMSKDILDFLSSLHELAFASILRDEKNLIELFENNIDFWKKFIDKNLQNNKIGVLDYFVKSSGSHNIFKNIKEYIDNKKSTNESIFLLKSVIRNYINNKLLY